MWRFTGVDICHGAEHVTSRYVGRWRNEIRPDVEGSNDFQRTWATFSASSIKLCKYFLGGPH